MEGNKLLEILLEHYWSKERNGAEYILRDVPYQTQRPTAVFEIHNVLRPKVRDDITAKEYCELIKSAYICEALCELGLKRGESKELKLPQSFGYTNHLEPGVVISSEIDLAGFGTLILLLDAQEKEQFDKLTGVTRAFLSKLGVPLRQ